MSDLGFSVREAARLVEIDENRLRYWAQSGFVAPSVRRAGRTFYAFADLIALRAAKGLTEAGFSVPHVRRCLDRLREILPGIERPLERLRVWSDGTAVIVEADDGPFDAATGQGVLDFRTDAISARAQEPEPSAAAPDKSGYSWFLEGCRLEDAGRPSEAERAYRTAVGTDPELASAWTNLGNTLYRRGASDEAHRAWAHALDVDPDQTEARYNLAAFHDDRGEIDLAIAEYRRVLRANPDFADAHFNLGMALQRVGGQAQSRSHFLRFIELYPNPDDGWMRIARARIENGASGSLAGSATVEKDIA